MTPVLIALDWGTSSLRAFLMDGQGKVLEQRASAHGIVNLPEPGVPGFEKAFDAICGEWLAANAGLPVVAGGMVGSGQGWREAPYVPCPANVASLAAQAAEVIATGGKRILIAPGVLSMPEGAAPDVARGEEIQIAGALLENPGLVAQGHFVMPGTHSKWLEVVDGRITRFATYMTGEMFAVLCQHSLLGRLMPEEKGIADEAEAAFARGVDMARNSRPGDLAHQIFATRTLGLTKQMPHSVLKDFLSGLLIGHEVVSAMSRVSAEAPLALIGDGTLCARYANAMSMLGRAPAMQLGNTAPAGLFNFAMAAGLIAPTKETAL